MTIFAREFARWRALGPAARLYLAHVALLTAGLAAPQLFFNLAVLALGHGRGFLGLLNTISFGAAAALSIPLWLGAGRIGLRRALALSAVLQASSALIFATSGAPSALIASAALGGVASVLFQVSAAPFMMRHSDDATRDHLFSASSALAIAVSGAATLVAGPLPAFLGRLIGAAPESAAAYRACFLASSALLALALLPLLFVKDEGGAHSAEGVSSEATHTLSSRASSFILQRSSFSVLVPLLLPPLLISCGAALLIPYLNLFYRERFGVGNTTLGLIFAGFDIATGAALLAGPAIARRIGKMPTVVLTRALALPFTLLMGFAPLLGISAGAALARVVLFNMAAPLYDAFAMERAAPESRPLAIGLIGGAYSAGYLFGPALSALVQERYGFGPIFVATTALYALSVLVTWWLFVRPAPKL
ncbi:MAG: hypothetical protein RLZZ387_1862 [Chloroflexota bacterium]|jgi:predicted MFS family arabinose efflux permease